jgi:ketosteroid isomerase-like protein
MSALLPEVLSTYFHAASAGRIDQACACFASDAVVHDEGRDHFGASAIRGWIEETTLKYQPRMEVTRIEESDERILATAIVSGSFPGSPVELRFAFTLRNGKICNLAIQ